MRLFDAHAHLAPGDASREALLATMAKLGVERAIVVAGGTVPKERLAALIASGGGVDVDPPNGGVLASCGRSGGKLIPYYFANPIHGKRAYAEEGSRFAGLKLGPAVHGVPFADARVRALVEQAAVFGHPVYLHCLGRPGFTVADFVAVAEANPDVTFILGHAGVGHCDFGAVRAIAPHRHVMFEMSGGFTSVCRSAVETLGAARVLFGSEYPLQDPRVEIAKLAALELAEEDLAQVSYRNASLLVEKGRASWAA